MKIAEIANLPRTVDAPSGGVHESVLRAFQILQRVKGFLERGVPGDVIMELIREMEDDPEDPNEPRAIEQSEANDG